MSDMQAGRPEGRSVKRQKPTKVSDNFSIQCDCQWPMVSDSGIR